MTDTRQSYSGFTVALHWVTAALVVSQIAIPMVTEDLARPERRLWMTGHMSLGLVLMIVTLGRLVVRSVCAVFDTYFAPEAGRHSKAL